MSAAKGLFITLEGGEGAGKSTQARHLADLLRAAGREVVLTREPGGTQAAEAIRRLLLDPDQKIAPMADTMLHFAARADHVDKLIAPAVRRGAIVICDRFYDSTMAYQGFGLGVDVAAIATLIRLINFTPDLSFFLQVSENVANERLAKRGLAADRYDLMGMEMRRRVAGGFLSIAMAEPQRCVLIDAGGFEAGVTELIVGVLRGRLGVL